MLEFLTTRDLRDGPSFGGRITTDNVEVDRDGGVGSCRCKSAKFCFRHSVGGEVFFSSDQCIIRDMGTAFPMLVKVSHHSHSIPMYELT